MAKMLFRKDEEIWRHTCILMNHRDTPLSVSHTHTNSNTNKDSSVKTTRCKWCGDKHTQHTHTHTHNPTQPNPTLRPQRTSEPDGAAAELLFHAQHLGARLAGDYVLHGRDVGGFLDVVRHDGRFVCAESAMCVWSGDCTLCVVGERECDG